MADDKSKTGSGDRKRVAADQGYELSYFARKHGLSTQDARTLLERFGNNRDKLNAEAESLAKSSPRKRRTTKPRTGQTSTSDARTRSSSKTPKQKTGLITKAAAVGAAVATGALLWSRRNQIGEQISKLSDEMSRRGRATEVDSDIAAQGTTGETFQPAAPPASGGGRSQVEIAEEALTLKEMGQTGRE